MSTDIVIVLLILFVLLLLIVTVLLLLWRSGFFLSLDIKTCRPPFEEIEVAYKFTRGSFADFCHLYTEVHLISPALRCIGVYYDNSDEVEGNNLRYIVGLILNDKDKEVDKDERQRILSKGFQLTTFPKVDYIVYAAFPNKSFISVLIAIHRLIPKFREYIKENKLQAHPLIEVCGGTDIVYFAPLSKQSEFFVYEALAESEDDVTSEQMTVDEVEETSIKDVEELPDTISSVDSTAEGGSIMEELHFNEDVLASLDDKNQGGNNGSEASTESFEELQLDS